VQEEIARQRSRERKKKSEGEEKGKTKNRKISPVRQASTEYQDRGIAPKGNVPVIRQLEEARKFLGSWQIKRPLSARYVTRSSFRSEHRCTT
jgi:hypothetical protein